jgi:AmmeMemoRadiSam system protein B
VTPGVSGYGEQGSSTSAVTPIATDIFLDPKAEQDGWAKAEVRQGTCRVSRGGVVNHHTLAPDLLADFFGELARCRRNVPTKTVIILTPDHWARGSRAVTVHALPYQVGPRLVEADREAIGRLQKTVLGLREDGEAFRGEHGVGALVPFMARVFPEAKLVPVMVRQTLEEDAASSVTEWLKEELRREGTIVVVSSDMSHYLSAETALQNDKETRTALQEGNDEFFWSASDTHTDNGKSLSILLRALGRPRWRELGHAISSDYAGTSVFTTTYLTGMWE